MNLTAGLWCAPTWGQRRGLVLPPQKAPKLCRWCAQPVPKGKQAWCSRACIDLYLAVGTWHSLCMRIHRRDRHDGKRCCRICRAIDCPDGWEVDHVLPVADGGTDDPANLRLLCIPCHRLVTALWRWKRRRAS